jgi:hypothetical protein
MGINLQFFQIIRNEVEKALGKTKGSPLGRYQSAKKLIKPNGESSERFVIAYS